MRSNTAEAIKALLNHELDCRREELQQEELISVAIIVKLDQRGIPRRILWRPEYQRDIRNRNERK